MFCIRYYHASFGWTCGIGEIREIKTAKPKVIMLTAFGQEDVTKKAVELGASYYILKPFDMEFRIFVK